jgi:fatty acid desaturase
MNGSRPEPIHLKTINRRIAVRDSLWLGAVGAVLVANSLLMVHPASPGWYAWLGVPIQGLLFVGMMEGFHQAVHFNLHDWRPANMLLGRLFGALLGLGFTAYRRFHLEHHALTNTPSDPERFFYEKAISAGMMFLVPFVALVRNANVINRGAYVPEGEYRSHRNELLSLVAARSLMVALTIFYPLSMLWLYWVPYLVFFLVELMIAQSQHYFSAERPVAPKGVEHYAEGVNIRLPAALGFLILYTNHHATHHVKASLKWYEVPAQSRRDAALVREVGLLQFAYRCLREGGKKWPVSSTTKEIS